MRRKGSIAINGHDVSVEELATGDAVAMADKYGVTLQAIYAHRRRRGIVSPEALARKQIVEDAVALSTVETYRTASQIIAALGPLGHKHASLIRVALRRTDFFERNRSHARCARIKGIRRRQQSRRLDRYRRAVRLIRSGASPGEAAEAVGYEPTSFQRNHLPRIRALGLL